MTTYLIIDFVGLAAATLTTICRLPQAVKVLREKETRAISPPAAVTLMTGASLRLVYGLAIGDRPLIGANAVSLMLMAPILVSKLRYG